MKILMLSQFYPPVVGGEEHAVAAMSRELLARDHEVIVGTVALDGTSSVSDEDGVEVHRLRTTSSRIGALYAGSRRHVPPAPDPELTVAISRLVRQVRPDVVHAHNWIIHSYLPVKRHSGASVLLSLHDYSHICANKRLMRGDARCDGPAVGKCSRCSVRYYEGIKGAIISLSLAASTRLTGELIDHLLPVSHAVAEHMRLDEGDVPFTVIPNFVPVHLAERRSSPRNVEIPDTPYILYVGDLSTDKGFDVLLRAFESLDGLATLVAVGRTIDVELPRIPGLRPLGVLPRFEVLEVMARCAVAVVPSVWWEPSGLVALESMAMGRPVVASATGGLSETVVNEVTGLLVPPRDEAALRAAITRLLEDPAAADRLGAAGRERAAREFSPDSVIPRLEQAYERSLGESRA